MGEEVGPHFAFSPPRMVGTPAQEGGQGGTCSITSDVSYSLLAVSQPRPLEALEFWLLTPERPERLPPSGYALCNFARLGIQHHLPRTMPLPHPITDWRVCHLKLTLSFGRKTTAAPFLSASDAAAALPLLLGAGTLRLAAAHAAERRDSTKLLLMRARAGPCGRPYPGQPSPD